MYNCTIRELYLSQTGLYTKEADYLGRFLSKNLCLKVLDISNNYIGDHGLKSLAKGLMAQTGLGLSVLVMFNNQLTDKSGPIIGNVIVSIIFVPYLLLFMFFYSLLVIVVVLVN